MSGVTMGEANGTGSVDLPPRATSVAHAWISAPCYRMLELEATARRLHPDVLAAKILERALFGDQVGLILDC